MFSATLNLVSLGYNIKLRGETRESVPDTMAVCALKYETEELPLATYRHLPWSGVAQRYHRSPELHNRHKKITIIIASTSIILSQQKLKF